MKSTKFANAGREQEPCKDFVDLHMHSTFSDGSLPVRDLIDYCVEQGLTAIAVTDHDNIDSYEDGREYAMSRGLEYVTGVEISSSQAGSDIHILGYMFDPTHLRLNRTLVDLRARRIDRAKQILGRLEKKGVLKHRQHRLKFLYSTTTAPAVAKRTALQQVVRTFFGGSLTKVIAALVAQGSWCDDDLETLKAEIDRVRQKRKQKP